MCIDTQESNGQNALNNLHPDLIEGIIEAVSIPVMATQGAECGYAELKMTISPIAHSPFRHRQSSHTHRNREVV